MVVDGLQSDSNHSAHHCRKPQLWNANGCPVLKPESTISAIHHPSNRLDLTCVITLARSWNGPSCQGRVKTTIPLLMCSLSFAELRKKNVEITGTVERHVVEERLAQRLASHRSHPKHDRDELTRTYKQLHCGSLC